MTDIILKYDGVLTVGYYNDMEAGHPVFIDGEPLSDIVKGLLIEQGLASNFCFTSPVRRDERDSLPGEVKNDLLDRRVELTLRVIGDD
jgi:hypothetical protein